MNNADTDNTYNTPAGEVGLVQDHDFVCKEPFTFENKRTISEFTIRYETYGKLNKEKNNAILICHALSGDHHCAGIYTLNDRKPGWWNYVIGPGKPIDTNRFFVICSNCLGGCQGTTGPSSINPQTNKPYNLNFPMVTIKDMVKAQKCLIAHLQLKQLYCVIGGSMGGMQALQWAIDYPEIVQRILPLATTARQSAQTIAFNEVGRNAIVQDPEWKNGNYEQGKGPNVGLAVARMMAHITYLSDKGLQYKFGRNRKKNTENQTLLDVEFEVESYLRYQGESFVSRFDANTYLYFTKALDRFDLYGQTERLEHTLEKIQARTLIIGFTSDWLFPPQQNRNIVHALLRCQKNATYAEVEIDLGHDSFLVHSPQLSKLIQGFLKHAPIHHKTRS
jgi:homoserine O-acetyltransferase/O-succinyltransferase